MNSYMIQDQAFLCSTGEWLPINALADRNAQNQNQLTLCHLINTSLRHLISLFMPSFGHQLELVASWLSPLLLSYRAGLLLCMRISPHHSSERLLTAIWGGLRSNLRGRCKTNGLQSLVRHCRFPRPRHQSDGCQNRFLLWPHRSARLRWDFEGNRVGWNPKHDCFWKRSTASNSPPGSGTKDSRPSSLKN